MKIGEKTSRHPVYDYDEDVKCSRSGQMHIAGNAFQRAVKTPSLSPLPQKGFAFGVGVAVAVASCFMTFELAVA